MDFELANWRFVSLLVFFTLLTLVIHVFLKSSIDQRPTQFANRYMMGLVLKLVLAFLLFIVMAIKSPEAEKIPFGVVFLVLYLSFNVFSSRQAMLLRSDNDS